MSKTRLRGIPFQGTPSHIGSENFDSAVRWFLAETPPSLIVRRLSGRLNAQQSTFTISVVDIYGLLYARHTVEAFPVEIYRRRIQNELSIHDFRCLYEAWGFGYGLKKCIAHLEKPEAVRAHAESVYRAIGRRFHDKASKNTPDYKSVDFALKEAVAELLDLAVVVEVNSRRAVVLYVDELPAHTIETFMPMRIERWVTNTPTQKLSTGK